MPTETGTVWSGHALDQLLTGCGISLKDVKYRVVQESWDGETRTILEIEPMFRWQEVWGPRTWARHRQDALVQEEEK